MKRKLLFLTSLVFLSCLRTVAQVAITVPSSPDTIVCNGAPLTLQAVTNGYVSHTVSLSIDDGYSISLPIGFTYNFYGTDYTNFVVSSNGFITFNTSDASGYSAWSITTGIPGNVNCENSVLGVYMDLYLPAGGTVTYGVAGTAPNRRLIVDFCDVHYFSCTSDKTTFEIILYETTNIAEVHTKFKQTCTSWNSGAGIQGVEKSTPSVATVAPGRNYPGTWTLTTPSARRFTPSTTTPVTYTCDTIPYAFVPDSSTIYWYSGSTYLGSGPTLTVNPTTPTTYTALAVTCSDTSRDSVTVTIGNGPVFTLSSTIPSVCGACDGTLTLSGLDPTTSDTINYNWNGVPQPQVVATPDGFGNITLTGLCSGTYDNITDKVGYCISNPGGPVIIGDPPFNITFVSNTSPSVCGACDASITIGGLVPGTNDTLRYIKDGVAAAPIYFVAPASGTYTFTGLCAGAYTNISVKMNTCTSTLPGPYTIVNPYFGISTVNSTNTSCSACDGTITIHGLTPGQTITINYDKDGVPQAPFTGVSGIDSTITLTGLCSDGPTNPPAVYSNITATLNTCLGTYSGTVSISSPPLIPITLYGYTQPTECGACNGTISIKGTQPGVIDSIFYTLDGVPQPAALYAAGPDSVVTLYNLCAGVYNNFYIKVGPCPTTTIHTPVTLVDSPIHAIFSTIVRYGCSGDTVYFVNSSYASGAADLYYTWNFGDGVSDTNITPMHIYTAQGLYNVTLTVTNHHCSNSMTLPVNLVHPITAAFTATNTAGNDTLCQLMPVTFTNTSVGNPPTYLWNFGDGTTDTAFLPNHMFTNVGTYTIQLIATNFVPCSDTAYQTVVVDTQSAVTITTITDTTICMGTYITFGSTFAADGLTHSVWNFGDGDSIINVNPVVYAYPTPGTFVVTETSYYRICATAQASHVINVMPVPTINLGPDTSICAGSDPIILYDNINAGNPFASWLWNTGATTSSIEVNAPGSFFASVTIGNCSASDSVTISNDCYMAMPNVFSPNGDGVNDYFYPRSLLTKGLVKFNMNIYNRWGQIVFTTSSIDGQGWDGKYNDAPQPQGVYIYIVDATFKDGQTEHHQGNLTLLR